MDHVAHHQGLDLVGREAGSLQRVADRDGAYIGRGHVLEAAAIGADGGADRVAEDDFMCAHDGLLWIGKEMGAGRIREAVPCRSGRSEPA